MSPALNQCLAPLTTLCLWRPKTPASRNSLPSIVRPHLGVDYAAPTGTPVVAVGSGAVEFAGFSGGSGRMVRLRHAERYETLYLHLSRMAVHRGERVAQGDVIGYVG